MKKYTRHFLIATVITLVLGFTGLEYIGTGLVRFIFLVSIIGLLVSCLDEFMVSKQVKPIRIKKRKKQED